MQISIRNVLNRFIFSNFQLIPLKVMQLNNCQVKPVSGYIPGTNGSEAEWRAHRQSECLPKKGADLTAGLKRKHTAHRTKQLSAVKKPTVEWMLALVLHFTLRQRLALGLSGFNKPIEEVKNTLSKKDLKKYSHTKKNECVKMKK